MICDFTSQIPRRRGSRRLRPPPRTDRGVESPHMRPLTVLMFVLVAPVVLAAQAWRHGSSGHFEVYSADGRSNLPETIQQFERVYGTLVRELDVAAGPSARSRVVIFENGRAMAPYRPRPDSRAYWFDTPNGDLMGLPPLDVDTWPDAVHEITHMVVGRSGAFYPLWLNEGLPLYYSTIVFTGDRVRIGAPPTGAVKTLTTVGFAVPLEQLFLPVLELGPEIDSRKAAVWYAEAWALTHLLFQGDAYRDKSKVFLGEIAAGGQTPAVFQKVFGKTVDAVLGDVKKHIVRFRLPSSTVPAPVPEMGEAFSVGAAEAVAVDQTLAEILGWQRDTERVNQGRAALAVLDARAPASLELLEARGLLNFHKGYCGDARDDLRRAVALNSQKPSVLRAYAQLLGDEPEHQRSLFARAAALDPVRPRPSIVIMPCSR